MKHLRMGRRSILFVSGVCLFLYLAYLISSCSFHEEPMSEWKYEEQKHTRAVNWIHETYDADIKSAPQDISLYLKRGKAYLDVSSRNADDLQMALADFSQAIDLEKKCQEAYTLRAKCQIELAKQESVNWHIEGERMYYLRALEDYNTVIGLAPENGAAYFGRSEVYTALRYPIPAILTELDRAISLQNDLAAAYLAKADILMIAGHYRQAAYAYTTGLAKTNLSYGSYGKEYYTIRRSLAYESIGYTGRMEEDRRNAGLGWGLFSPTMTQSQTESLRQLYMLPADSPEKRFCNRPDKEIAELDRLIADHPGAQLYNRRGVLYDSIGRIDAAIADFSQAIALDVQFCEAYMNRSIAYDNYGDAQQARADIARALTLQPMFAEARAVRAQYDLEDGLYPDAAETYAALTHKDLSAFCRLGALGSANLRAGANTAALAALDDATQAMQPIEDQLARSAESLLRDHMRAALFGRVYLNRAKAHSALGQSDQALKDYQTALDLSPLLYYELPEEIRAAVVTDRRREVQDCTNALAKGGDTAALYFQRGIAYYMSRQSEAARLDFDKAIKLDPTLQVKRPKTYHWSPDPEAVINGRYR